MFHGDKDPIVSPINGNQVMEAAFGNSDVHSMRTVQGHEGRDFTRHEYVGADGLVCGEHWHVHEGGHAWFGGSNTGSHSDAMGPNASEAMLRFFEVRRSTHIRHFQAG